MWGKLTSYKILAYKFVQHMPQPVRFGLKQKFTYSPAQHDVQATPSLVSRCSQMQHVCRLKAETEHHIATMRLFHLFFEKSKICVGLQSDTIYTLDENLVALSSILKPC